MRQVKPVKVITLVFVFLAFAAFAVTSVADTVGVKKKRPKPQDYGNVVIDNYSVSKSMSPVVFKHWLHRSKFSCRLCHVDLGFAMVKNQTEVTCADNKAGFYCGTCHNGDTAFSLTKGEGTPVLKDNCILCHSQGRDVKFKNDFNTFRRSLKRERFGNGIDWLDAEERNLVTLVDYIEGVTIKGAKMEDPKDIEIRTFETLMPNIIFSHKKHAVWSGCELCHPDMFGVKRGEVPYSMQEVFDGKFCGACHGLVAFPNYDCQRCHTKEVH